MDFMDSNTRTVSYEGFSFYFVGFGILISRLNTVNRNTAVVRLVFDISVRTSRSSLFAVNY